MPLRPHPRLIRTALLRPLRPLGDGERCDGEATAAVASVKVGVRRAPSGRAVGRNPSSDPRGDGDGGWSVPRWIRRPVFRRRLLPLALVASTLILAPLLPWPTTTTPRSTSMTTLRRRRGARDSPPARHPPRTTACRCLPTRSTSRSSVRRRSRLGSTGSGYGPTIPPLFSQRSTPQYFSYGGYQSGGTSKKIDIPNGRVGVIIGKYGETIKHLQLQSGAKIQVTRDMDVQPGSQGSQTGSVELSGTPDQISRAEQLISDVLAEADAASSGTVSSQKYNTPQPGAEQFQMQIANNKVGLVIEKGGETIISMQAKSGARIQTSSMEIGCVCNRAILSIDYIVPGVSEGVICCTGSKSMQ